MPKPTVTRYTNGPNGLELCPTGEWVRWTEHEATMSWLMRMKAGVQDHLYGTYRAYLHAAFGKDRHA